MEIIYHPDYGEKFTKKEIEERGSHRKILRVLNTLETLVDKWLPKEYKEFKLEYVGVDYSHSSNCLEAVKDFERKIKNYNLIKYFDKVLKIAKRNTPTVFNKVFYDPKKNIIAYNYFDDWEKDSYPRVIYSKNPEGQPTIELLNSYEIESGLEHDLL